MDDAMKRWLPALLILTLIFPLVSRADELDDVSNALQKKYTQLQQSQQALSEAKKKEAAASSSLGGLQSSLNIAIAEVNVKQAELDAAIAELDQQTAQLKQQEYQRVTRVRSLYKTLKQDMHNPLLSMLDSGNLSDFARMYGYQNAAVEDDKAKISELDAKISAIDQRRAELQAQADVLKSKKAQLEAQANALRNQIAQARSQAASANNKITNLNKDIKGLNADQQRILTQKAAANGIITTVGDSVPASTTLPSPGFSPAYAFASYGAPHRVGMNQYGAYGRAKAGQNYQQILTTYYKNTGIETVGVPGTIDVQGFGHIAFEANYLKGISEMPRSWPLEALKAQAIAARTYAMKYIQDNGGAAICITQSCQVYNGARINGTGADDLRWYQAVAETQGQVLKQNGGLISAWYSSTNGGYTQSSQMVWGGVTGWTHVVKDYAGSWPAGAYDKDSPWFRKSWGSRTGSGYNPWLTKPEVIDLLNSALLYERTGAASGPGYEIKVIAAGGSTPQQIESALQVRGITPVGNFSSLAFLHNDGTGQTQIVRAMDTAVGTLELQGTSMFAAINLRAPGSVELKSKLFDVITQ